MSVIPCHANDDLDPLLDDFVEALKTQAHTLGGHGLSEAEFYRSGLLRAAIERVRGEFSASMAEKRQFVSRVLNDMQDRQLIRNWEPAGSENRHDYIVTMPTGRITAIELKGCLDGNNTTIFTRPANAEEFFIWSVCTNPAADPRKNAWSGLHVRLSAEIAVNGTRVDGVAIWDMYCGTFARQCPKLDGAEYRVTHVGQYTLPPPCLYVFPATVPHPRNNPVARAQPLDDTQFLKALHDGFRGIDREVNYVDFEVRNVGAATQRKTRVRRDGQVVRESGWTELRRE